MKSLSIQTLLFLSAALSCSSFADSVPNEQEFITGEPVILDYNGDDAGKRNTGLRLTSMGLFRDSGTELWSVWRVRNSGETAQDIDLIAYGSNWQTSYTIKANSDFIVTSPHERGTHQLVFNGNNLDTKAAGSQQYDLPEQTADHDNEENSADGSDMAGSAQVFQRGMQAWRKEDEIFAGAACANCHAPDGFDLAYFDFSREDIIRRAAPHLPDEADQLAIADLIEYIREQYQIINPKDPLTFRPFQPGSGEPLAGENRFVRDEAFGRQFKDGGFRFANIPVLSMDEALTQRDEWLTLDVRDIDLGIAMPLWSEDGFHGEQHVSLNDWLPSLPRLPKPEHKEQWYARQDAYIANPTDENFFSYYEAIDKDYINTGERGIPNPQFTHQPFKGSGTWMSNSKFKAVQFAQHLFRNEYMLDGQDRNARPINGFARIAQNKIRKARHLLNPMWAVGDFFRVNDGLQELQLPTEAPFPPGLADTFVPFNEHAEQIKVAWFTLGWLFDPALTKTCCGNPGKTAEYFHDALSRAKEIGPLESREDKVSYPLHNQFIFTKKVVSKLYEPYAVDCDPVCEADSFNIKSSNFFGYRKHVKNIPNVREEQRAMYIHNTLNSIRMLLYLMEDYLDRGMPVNSKAWRKLGEGKAFLWAVKDENPHHQHDVDLYARLDSKLNGE